MQNKMEKLAKEKSFEHMGKEMSRLEHWIFLFIYTFFEVWNQFVSNWQQLYILITDSRLLIFDHLIIRIPEPAIHQNIKSNDRTRYDWTVRFTKTLHF